MRHDNAAKGSEPPAAGWRSVGVNIGPPPFVKLEFDGLNPMLGSLDSEEVMAHNVEIYSSMNCPYCVAAKNFLKQKGLDYTEIRIDTNPAERDKMIARTQRRTVPQIFIDGHHVRGFDDMVAADRDGRLAKILGNAA